MVCGMFRNKGFIFTNKEYSKTGIMYTVFGVLSFATLGTAVYLSYQNGGASSARYGAAAFLAVIFWAAGMMLGIYSTTEKEKFRLFTVLGIFVNLLAFGMLSLILFAGAYVE